MEVQGGGGGQLFLVDLDLSAPKSCPTDQLILPQFYLPKQNQPDSGMSKIKVNPTQVTGHQPHPVPVLQKCAW